MRFIGVSFGVVDTRLVCIATSEDYTAIKMDGFSSREGLEVLSSIATLRERIARTQPKGTPKPALVMYDTAVDLEILFAEIPADKKDILFGLYRVAENKAQDTPIFDPTTPEYRGIVQCYGFKLSALPGKVLRVARAKRSGLIYYDVSGYFDHLDVNEAAAKFLGAERAGPRIERNVLPLWQGGVIEALADRCEAEAKLITRLADKVNEVVEPLEIGIRQWYGPSAVAARCLHKWGARKQAKRLTDKNSPYELIRAIDCAYFGGRVEALKLGTVRDVRTFDLNSAYAYATTLLAQFHTTLRFVREYRADAPFSCWFASYQLPDNVSLGVLPTRQPLGGISFRREGKGYFWQPEIDYLRQRYPDSVRIKWGYVGPDYEPVTFAKAIHDMYEYRQRLKAQGDAGESIIKLALSNLYGKFAQNTGAAHFQCRAWAGWITSFVRRLLLEAVTGIEDKVICFCQDAIHLAGADATVSIGEGLGEWKTKRFASGLYVSPGIYSLTDYGELVKGGGKDAVRGCNLGLDFDRIARDLSERQVSELSRSFFVGWVLSRQASVRFGADYLQEVQESLDLIPTRIRARNYTAQFDWSNDYRDSSINSRYMGESARYVPSELGRTAALRLKLKDRGWA